VNFGSSIYQRSCTHLGIALTGLAMMISSFTLQAAPTDQAPKASDWAALAKLPDFSGVWLPDVGDQMQKVSSNTPPWTPAVAAQMAHLDAEEKAGRPFLVLNNCFPHGMPSWMLINHNAMEILLTPGRVTMLGEADGNRMRRIYTDGRKHPEDPDLTLHGHSTGHWEGQTLVIDTIGVAPQAYIAVSEAVGIPNNGDMHITERIRLVNNQTLQDELVITAPKVLTAPWKTTRIFYRRRGAANDIVEGQCVQGMVTAGKDKHGNDVFIPHATSEYGGVVPLATSPTFPTTAETQRK
jgi:hypothetical protein